jgi:hypothetical protein
MHAEYSNFGIHFSYPSDWSIVDEEKSEWPRRVSVQSPDSAYCDLQVYPPDYSPGALTEQTLEIFRQEYEDLDVEPVFERVHKHEIVGYDLDFFCLDFMVTCRVRSFSLAGQTLLLICQAESREYEHQRGAFEAITRSWLPAAPPPPEDEAV